MRQEDVLGDQLRERGSRRRGQQWWQDDADMVEPVHVQDRSQREGAEVVIDLDSHRHRQLRITRPMGDLLMSVVRR